MLTVLRKSIGHINGVNQVLNEVQTEDGDVIGTFNATQIANRYFYTKGSASLYCTHLTRLEFIDIIKKFAENVEE